MNAASGPGEIIDDLKLLLDVLPARVRSRLAAEPGLNQLLEVILDLGRSPEARYYDRSLELTDIEVSREDLEQVVGRVGAFSGDNRAGIERTLHRISALRNRQGEIIGLTCRVGRAVTGTVDIILDCIESGRSLLLLGPPGVGKTTLLREAARVLADSLRRRVIVVDTSNEIGGDGDVPHPAIGHARRMQVPSPEQQHRVMIEAVENHMPEVILIDEIGTELEAQAARTIAERGVQLIATAHGITLDNLVQNPTLSDLIGGVQAVTLSDEEARRRGTQKTVLERKAPPTFDILVEIQNRESLAVYPEIGLVVDRLLAGRTMRPEVRIRGLDGSVEVRRPEATAPELPFPGPDSGAPRRRRNRLPRIYPLGVSKTRLERAIRELGAAVRLADQPLRADIILAVKSQRRRQPKTLRAAVERGARVVTLRSNNLQQIKTFLSDLSGDGDAGQSPYGQPGSGIREAEDAVVQVQRHGQPVSLSPQNAYIRRLQHELIGDHGLLTESSGEPPQRRVVVYPREV